MTNDESNASPEVSATVTTAPNSLRACLDDRRREAAELFGDLDETERSRLAEDAWRVGLRALGNAYSQARESRLEDVGRTLLDDMRRQLMSQLESQNKTLTGALLRFFDPQDGEVARRLEAFVADEGTLARFLSEQIGSEQSVLVETLARGVGEKSELFRRLNPEDKQGLVSILEERLALVMTENQRELFKALDPLAEGGAVAKMLGALRAEIETADEDRSQQLAKALAALDANDPTSLISQLGRETRDAKNTLLRSLNPQDPESPIAAVKTAVERMLEAHGQTQRKLLEAQNERHRELELLIRETVVRLEGRKEAETKSPRGGATFEAALVSFVEEATRGGAYLVEATGSTTGLRRGCKVGDLVVSFTEESAFAGCRLVIEAKRDASYTVAKAVAEMDIARENRGAPVGIFVLAASHAPAGFPDFARYGNTLLTTWDVEDPSTDPTLRGALVAGLAMATRRRSEVDEGDLKALQDVERRVQDELNRLVRIRKSNERIRQSSDDIKDELRKAERKFELLLEKAKDTLRALNVELAEEEVEAATPILLGPTSANTVASAGTIGPRESNGSHEWPVDGLQKQTGDPA